MATRDIGQPAARETVQCLQVRMWPLIVILNASAALAQPVTGDCTSAEQCRALALDAIARQDYERAHDFAWRVVQTSPRRDRDPAAMSLLARAQSLSGRGYDALIMLGRLVDLGVIIDDVDTSDDFRRVRDYPEWPQLLERITALRASVGATSATGAAGAAATTEPTRAANASVSLLVPRRDKRNWLTPLAAPAARLAPVAPVTAALPLPSSIASPGALAYDAVSARFIVADASSDLLHVVSETSGNATNLVGRGWSGGLRMTALAIDRQTGNLWLAGSGTGASVYRLQLISGRLLQTFAAPGEGGEAELIALVTSATGVFALDGTGRRILTLAPDREALQVFATLPADIVPTGMASSGASLYVAHTAGVLRIDSRSKAQRALAVAKGIDVSSLHSLAWHKGALLAIQRQSAPVAVRVQLNARGTAATGLDVLAPAAASAAALSGDAYYYLTNASETGLVFRSVPLGK
jgi:hypothetical protein